MSLAHLHPWYALAKDSDPLHGQRSSRKLPAVSHRYPRQQHFAQQLRYERQGSPSHLNIFANAAVFSGSGLHELRS